MASSEIDDRRQRAREAYHDAPGGHATYPETRLNLAIEAATQVKITEELITVFASAWHSTEPTKPGARRSAGLRAAFAAAGFEVIE